MEKTLSYIFGDSHGFNNLTRCWMSPLHLESLGKNTYMWQKKLPIDASWSTTILERVKQISDDILILTVL